MTCRKIDSSLNRFSSFHITAECNEVTDIYNPQLWPAGTNVCRYYEARRPRANGGEVCGPVGVSGDCHVVVEKLLETCDILCVQETFLAKQDLDRLTHFNGAGESTTDLSTKIIQSRITGGVAILRNKKYDQLVNVLRLDV